MITFILPCILSVGLGIITCISVTQNEKLRIFVPGNTVVLVCTISGYTENYYSWFRQSLGEASVCIITLYAGSIPTRYGDFKDDQRFTATKSDAQFTLTITDTRQNDTGIYYCAARDYDHVMFGSGVFLEYEGPILRHQYYINQLMSLEEIENTVTEPVHPGDSVTLQCSVLTENCAGEHNVYWFRQGSGESHPGIIYTHGGNSDQCSKRPEAGSSTQSCVYSLPKMNLSLSDAGIYYCAVAMCGEILFGNGSRLTIEESESSKMHPMVPALAALNALFFIIILVLLCTMCSRRNVIMSGKPDYLLATTAPSISPVPESMKGEELSYAAINLSGRKSKSRETERDSQTNVTYSSVGGLK